jgi:uncharacterized repeat protein (TIGR02543 family)
MYSHFNKKIFSIILSVVVIFSIFGIASKSEAAARSASVSGNWSSTTTWGGSPVPVAGDTCTINNGIAVTVDIAAVCTSLKFPTANKASSLTISGTNSLTLSGALTLTRPSSGGGTTNVNVNTGTLSAGSVTLGGTTSRLTAINISTGTMSVTGNITSAGTFSRIIFSGAGTLNAGGTFMSTTQGTFTPSSSTVNYNASGNQTVNPFAYTYNNLTLSGTSTKTLGAATVVNGNLSIANSSVTFARSNFLLTLWGNFTNSGGTMTGTGAVTITGTADQSIAGFPSGGTFSMTKTGGTATLTGNVNAGQLTINGTGGTLHMGTGLTHVFNGTWQRTAGTVNGGSSIFKFAFSAATNTGTFIPGTSTVEWNSGGTQTVAPVTYYNLTIGGTTGAKTIPAGTSVTGNLSIASTGSSTASIAALQNISVGTLTLGGVGRINGTWGGTGSGATNINTTYFAATTGYLTVTTSTAPTYTLTIPASTGTGTGTYGGTAAGSINSGTAVSITATPDASSDFTSWTATGAASACNGTTSSPCAFSMTAAASVTAVYTLKTYTFAISPAITTNGATGTGITCNAGVCAGTYNYNTAVTVAATAVTGYTALLSGTGSASACSGTSCVVTMTSNTTVTAVYTLNTYTFAISPAITTNGATGTGITCNAGVCAGTYNYNTAVTVAATAVTGYTALLSGTGSASACSGTSCVVTMTSNTTVTAVYTPLTYTVTFNSNGGSAVSPISGVAYNTTITLPSAPTKTGYTFNGWFTDDTTFLNAFTSSTLVVAHITVYAKWTAITYTLTYTAGVNGTISGTTPQIINIGADGTEVIAVPNEGYNFTSWSDGVLTASRTDTNVTSNISVTASFATAATKFVIVDPTDNTVGNNVTVAIRALDSSDTLVNTYNNTVTLVASGSATGEGAVNIVNGVGTIDISDIVAETVNLSLTDAHGLDDTSTQDVVFSPGELSHFIIDNISSQVSGTEFSVTITAKDSYENTVPLFVDKVNFSTTTGGTITPSLSNDFIAGILTQTNVKLTQSGDGKTITVIRQGESENGTSNSFSVSPGNTYRYTLNNPSDILTGTRAGYVATRRDENNNLVINDTDTVYLSASTGSFYDAAVDGNVITEIDIADTNSSINFWYLGDTAGNKEITVSDNSSPDGSTGIIDATDSIVVSDIPIVPTRLVILDTTSAVAGASVEITVQAQDDFGNVDTTFTGTVNLVATGSLPRPVPETLTPGGIVTFINGQGTITIIDTKAETVTLSLNSPSVPLDVSSTKNQTFTPGVFNYFTMDSISSSPSAGINFPIVITAKDINGNIDTSFIGTVDFTTTAGDISPLISNNFISGILNQNIYVTGAGTGKTITATKTSDIQYVTSGPFDVTGGTVSSFDVESSGGGNITLKTINVPFDIKITAKDSYGNIATGFNGSVNITSTGSLASGGGGTSSFTEGILTTHSVTISNSGSFTITATNTIGSEIGISNSFDVQTEPIVATKFIIIDPSDVQIGSSTIVTVQAVDSAGNLDDTFEGDINLVTSGAATGGGLVDIVNGAGTRTITDNTVETVFLSLSDITPPTTLDFTSTQSVVFSATPPSGGGGGRAQVIAPVISFTGRAFPLVNVEMMAIRNGQIPIGNTSKGTGEGNFNIAYNGQLPSDVNTFALVVYDKDKKITQTKLFKLGVNDQLLATIIMSPTVNLNQQLVTLGTFMGLTGSGMPKYKIELMIDGVIAPEIATVDGKGNYNLTFNTYRLGLGEHTLRVRQTDAQGKSSDYSIEKVFTITKSFVPRADLNNDGKIDISDWSIFITRYNSSDTTNRGELDLNSDGAIDIKDFSYFIGALAR